MTGLQAASATYNAHGFQATGAFGTDLRTLRTAAWIESVIGATRAPEQR